MPPDTEPASVWLLIWPGGLITVHATAQSAIEYAPSHLEWEVGANENYLVARSLYYIERREVKP